MNEEHEKEQNGLGDLPEDILHERQEIVYNRTPIPGAEGVASAVSARNARHSRESAGKEEVARSGPMSTPHYKANVQSTFDVRPVNAIDKIFGGLIELRIPGTFCEAVTVAPVAPFTFDYGTISGPNFVVDPVLVAGSCAIASVRWESGATTIGNVINIWNFELPGHFNAYLFEDGVLIDTNLNFDAEVAVVFGATRFTYDSVTGREYIIAITGFDSLDSASDDLGASMGFRVST